MFRSILLGLICVVFFFSCVTAYKEPEQTFASSESDIVGTSTANDPQPSNAQQKQSAPFDAGQYPGHLSELSYTGVLDSYSGETVGYTVHYGQDKFPPYIREYIKMYSNWKFQDSNSIFIRYNGDDSMTDIEYLFPGVEYEELERLTEESGVVYWMPSPSLLWVSAKDYQSLRDSDDDLLKFLVAKLAHNPYRTGSWINITGHDLGFDYVEHSDAVQSKTPSPTDYEDFGIDYSNPGLYLESGPRSTLDDDELEVTRRALEAYVGVGPDQYPKTVQGAVNVMWWVQENFTSGGPADFQLEVDDYYDLGKTSGCTENALVLVTALRAVGIPAVYIITVDIPTAWASTEGQSINNGHQMVEAYVEGEWILLEGYHSYTDEYDPTSPSIYRTGRGSQDWNGFVIGKGLDSWDIGMMSQEDYTRMSTLFVSRLNSGELDEYIENPTIYQMK